MGYDTPMDITEAAHLARTLMNAHGLGHIPFQFNRAKRTLGMCTWERNQFDFTYRVKNISLSREFVPLLPEDEVRDVILHEIAHALTNDPHEHHGARWRMIARQIGAKPQRCATPSARPTGSITRRCSAGHEDTQHRLPLRVKSCSVCSTVWKKDHVFTYFRDGREIPVTAMPERYRSEYRRVM